ncbi:hypothetical protein L1077_22475 [Pseudoalteromonas luteoviolacea]|uniref:hypothetical protein n=1 Tax=Pseudoalteromonas luteoviolacea TaxID=43657 RepID=UPI001F1694B8|nr:hypothetical protein [Pseudoalteromonas luteoviolacea]MCF6442196.1 hypothetical protein [Pseudoalteromonas luteoviolacea]
MTHIDTHVIQKPKILEDKLVILHDYTLSKYLIDIVDSLKQDKAILINDVSFKDANKLMLELAKIFNLQDSLELNSNFSSTLEYRQKVGKYFMTVNKRKDYQFVAPHSEGSSKLGIQLAAFYSVDNTTDGGETVLFKTNHSSDCIKGLKENLAKGKILKKLSSADLTKIKILSRLSFPEDALTDGDEVLSEKEYKEGFVYCETLVKTRAVKSVILNKEVYPYFDSIERIDSDSPQEYLTFLKNVSLFKEPESDFDFSLIDDSHHNRIGSFGSKYNELFEGVLIKKLTKRQMLICNNLTWCHSVANWTPGSGVRKVVAAFA